MFDQSYQQLYLQRQVIALGQAYPCPRCKSGNLQVYGDTETFVCANCRRNFVALNAGRILYPAYSMKTKIAPVFWWDGLHWHFAGTTASAKQVSSMLAAVLLPMAVMTAFICLFNHGQMLNHGHLGQNFYLNLSLLNILVGFFVVQLLYLMCWDQDGRTKRNLRQSTGYKH